MSSDSGEKRWPGDTDEAHPEIFTTIPPQPTELKPGQLSPDQVKQYFEQGYVVLDSFFNVEDELDPVKEDIKILIDDLAERLHRAGKISQTYSELGFYQRLTAIDKEFPGANIVLHKLGRLPTSFRSLWSNERMLNVVEQLLGTSDIVGHPVWNLRTKTPQNEATTVPWHQDAGYLDNDAYRVLQVTAWIPLINAVPNNGCLQVVKGGHRTGKVATHQCCHGGTWYVMLEEEEMKRKLGVSVEEDSVVCPVPYGGVVLFNNMIPHRSLNNSSDTIRWSMDLRWQSADKCVGFYGLKEGVRMRSSTDPDFKVNWGKFDNVNRHKEALKMLEQEETDFDTTIPGPWMKKWEIVHINRHVEEMQKGAEFSTKWHSLAG